MRVTVSDAGSDMPHHSRLCSVDQYLIYLRPQLSCWLWSIQLYVKIFVLFNFWLKRLLWIDWLQLRLLCMLLKL